MWIMIIVSVYIFFFFQAEDGIRYYKVTGVQTCALPISQDKANIDGLTAVFNKRYFQERLTDEIDRAGKEGAGLSLLLLDIDDFKNYNDTNGHVAGDDVLRDVGRLLRSSLREDD